MTSNLRKSFRVQQGSRKNFHGLCRSYFLAQSSIAICSTFHKFQYMYRFSKIGFHKFLYFLLYTLCLDVQSKETPLKRTLFFQEPAISNGVYDEISADVESRPISREEKRILENEEHAMQNERLISSAQAEINPQSDNNGGNGILHENKVVVETRPAKLGPADFELLKVIGKGAFGKVNFPSLRLFSWSFPKIKMRHWAMSYSYWCPQYFISQICIFYRIGKLKISIFWIYQNHVSWICAWGCDKLHIKARMSWQYPVLKIILFKQKSRLGNAIPLIFW